MDRTGFEQWKSKEVARLLALVETERRYYQEMIAALPAPVVVLGASLTPVYANRAFRQSFGLRADDLRCKTIGQLIPSEELQAAITAAHAQGHATAPFQIVSGERILRIAIVPTRNWDDESEIETLLLVEDITDVVAPQAAPEPPPPPPLPPMPDDLFASLPAVVWQADPGSLVFVRIEGPVEALLGYPPEHWTASEGFFESRIHPQDRESTLELYRAIIDTGGEASAEYRATNAQGKLIWCRETIRVSGTVETGNRRITGMVANISQRKEMEQQLFAAARHDALHQIAGRLAHDLNNPLMIARGYGEELLQAVGASSAARRDAEEVLAATARIANVTAHLTEFSRRHATAPSRVELNALFSLATTTIVRATGTRLDFVASPEPLWVVADRDQLTEVILAFASSANEGAKGRTRITIDWSTYHVTECIGLGTLPAGTYARVTLRDDGPGLDPGRIWTLFEGVLPGKDPSDTAPTLARAYSIIREWGGDVTVTSSPGQGTAYLIYLSLAGMEQSTSVQPELPPEPPAPDPTRETILVVDDEDGIRGLVRKILKRERYHVLEAASAEDALAIAVSHGGPIHMLLTDVMLPGLKGPELAKRLVESTPNLRVLYISGYTDDESVRAGDYPAGSRFLPKPFTLSALVNSVRETLDAN